jgi:hypothetical protein
LGAHSKEEPTMTDWQTYRNGHRRQPWDLERLMELRWLRIPLHVTDIDAFVRLGLLKEDEREDEEALRTAVMSLVYRAGEGLA